MVTAKPILFIDHALALGGAERSLLLLLQHLERERFTPHLACTEGPLAEAAAAFNVSVHTVTLPRLRRSSRVPLDWLAGVRALTRVARQVCAATLVANTVRAAMYAALAARLIHVPFVWHMRDFWLSESRPCRLWADTLGKRLLCAATAHVITNSQAVAAHLPSRRRITVVYNGIEIERFDPAMDGTLFRARYGIPPDVPLVGTVGRLRPWKGQARFLWLAAQVVREVPEARFLVVGGEPFGVGDDYSQRLRCLAVELNLADQVAFTGHLNEVRPALAAMDVFVHPGDPEPFGLVNVEAMAMGKPVVAFAHGALPEIVLNMETGLLVTPEDEATLAEAILTLLRDSARRQVMGRAGRARVEARFTAERMAAEVEAVWQEVVG
jgi:glycosyltransferase involved in cell wall biosynthesis